MLQWAHDENIAIGCFLYGFFLVMALLFGRIVGKLTRALAWTLAFMILTTSGMAWGGNTSFTIFSETLHGGITLVVLSVVLVLTPAAVMLDRRHG